MSIEEVVKDISGPLSYLVKVSQNFENTISMGKIVTRQGVLFVHGKSDSLIPWHHSERLYELCTARKLLVCPQEMEHNTNLLSKVEYFVLPMLQFFSLPDYCFEDVTVPDWVFTPPPLPVQEQPGVTPAAVSTGGSNEKGERGPRAGTIMEPPFSLL